MNVNSAVGYTPPKATRFIFVLMLLNCMMWASGHTFSKISLQGYSPEFIVFFRVTIAGVLLTPFVTKLWPEKIYSRKDLFLILILTLIDPIGFTAFQTMAMQYTSASQAAALGASSPILSTLAAFLILKEKTSWQVIVCLMVAACGVVLLTSAGEKSSHATNPLLGNLFVVLTMSCGMAFSLIVRFLGGRYKAMFLVWVQCLGSSLLMLPMFPMGKIELPVEFHLYPTLALIYLGVGLTLGAQALTCYTIARVPISRGAAIGNLNPIFGLSFGILLLGETLLPIQWAACGVILSAVLACQYFQADFFKNRRKQKVG